MDTPLVTAIVDVLVRLALALLLSSYPVKGAASAEDVGAGIAAPAKGWATWCAPTPTRCHGWGGSAHLGAVPSFHFGDEPYTVRVQRVVGGEVRTTFVTVVSDCGCGDRHGKPTLIDLSLAAFRDLGPLWRGVITVTVERVDGVPTGPRPTLPPTDAVQ